MADSSAESSVVVGRLQDSGGSTLNVGARLKEGPYRVWKPERAKVQMFARAPARTCVSIIAACCQPGGTSASWQWGGHRPLREPESLSAEESANHSVGSWLGPWLDFIPP